MNAADTGLGSNNKGNLVVFWTPNWIHRTEGKVLYAGHLLRMAVASLALASLSVTAWAGGGGTNDLAALKSLSLEDLAAVQVDTVVGASKHEQKVTEAPSAVSIVTADGRQFRRHLIYKS